MLFIPSPQLLRFLTLSHALSLSVPLISSLPPLPRWLAPRQGPPPKREMLFVLAVVANVVAAVGITLANKAVLHTFYINPLFVVIFHALCTVASLRTVALWKGKKEAETQEGGKATPTTPALQPPSVYDYFFVAFVGALAQGSGHVALKIASVGQFQFFKIAGVALLAAAETSLGYYHVNRGMVAGMGLVRPSLPLRSSRFVSLSPSLTPP